MNFDTLIAVSEAELTAARSAREAATADQKALLAGVEADARKALTEDEQARFDGLSIAKREADAKITAQEARLNDCAPKRLQTRGST